MVNGKMCELLDYIPDEKREKVALFINKISTDMSEGKYEIDGDDVYAQIMSYSTKAKDECTVEAHDIYRDIQFSLIGEEGISIFVRSELKLRKATSENDFYEYETNDNEYMKIKNRPGYFTMINTNEAHRPQESVDIECSTVKKGVIKIKEVFF